MDIQTKQTNDGHYWRCHWLIQRAGEAAAKGRVLDVGCSDGWMFMQHGWNIVELDKVVAIPKDKRNKPLVKADAERLPLKNGSFAGVILGDMLEHVRDPLKALNEAKRVGAAVYITVPNEWEWSEQARPFRFERHLRFYDAPTLTDHLTRTLGPNHRITKVNGGGWSFFCAEWPAT